MRLLYATLALAVVVSAVTLTSQRLNDLPREVADGYYPARSGNLILEPATSKPSDALAVLIDYSTKFFAAAGSPAIPPSIEMKHVADVIARSLGVSVPNPHYSPEFVANDLFNRPKANILLSVDSLGADTLQSFDLQHLQTLAAQHTAVPLDHTSYPQNALATAATLATGANPAQHGIVANAWKKGNAKVNAYSSASAWSTRVNTADVLAQTFGGQSMQLSASADVQHAQAFSTHPSLDAPHSFCLTLKDGAFKSTAPSSGAEPFTATTDLLLQRLRNTALFAASQVELDLSELDAAHRRITVSYTANSKRQTATFDLDAPAEAAFFHELLYFESLAHTLTSEPALKGLVRDSAPDLIALSFTAHTRIIEAHGRNSPHAVAAMHLLDAAVPVIGAALLRVYDGRAVAEVVFTGSHRSFSEAVDKRELLATVNRLLPNQDARTYFPAMYVDTTALASPLMEVCQVLAVELDKLSCNVFCPQPSAAAPNVLFQLSESTILASTARATNSTAGQTSVFRYQIVLWLSIVVALFALGAAYSLAWMTFKKDTLLYSTFNPNWAERKRL